MIATLLWHCKTVRVSLNSIFCFKMACYLYCKWHVVYMSQTKGVIIL